MRHLIRLVFIAAAALFLPLSAEADYTDADVRAGRKLLDEMRQVKRKSYWDKPKFFVRSQTKYSGRLFVSRYSHPDRPLFNNRLLQKEGPGFDRRDSGPFAERHQKASFLKNFELYRLSGLDGFATFAWPGEQNYRFTLKTLYEAAARTGSTIMLETMPGYLKAQQFEPTLELIRDGRPSLRLKDGKSLFGSYVMDSLSPQQIAGELKRYQKSGHPEIVLLPQINFLSFKGPDGRKMNQFDIHTVYKKYGTLPASLLNALREYLRGYRDVCAGLYLGSYASNIDLTLDADFTRDILIPLFKSVLAEADSDGKKIFAMQGKVGYCDYAYSYSLTRGGTKTLRQFLDLAADAGVDLYIGTEWDELGEDTGFEPLVGKPMSTMRILRFHTASVRGEKLSPLPGDDQSIPNLIVSQRRQLHPGADLHIELLNVPDGVQRGDYTVEVLLADENGKHILTAGPFTFDAGRLQEKNIHIPTEKYPDVRVFQTRIRVKGFAGKTAGEYSGLPFTVMRPSVNEKHYSCTPLRNLLIPEKAKIVFSGDTVSADFAASSKILTAEVMQDHVERFSFDPHDEFLQNDPDRILFRFRKLSNNPPPRLLADMELAVENAPSLVVFTGFEGTRKAEGMKHFPSWKNMRVDVREAPQVYFSIRRQDLGKAVFTAKLLRRTGPLAGKTLIWKQPVKDVSLFCPANEITADGINLWLERDPRPGIQPLPFGDTKFSFSRWIPFDNPEAVVSLRVVSEDGKVFWSAPHPRRETVDAEKIACTGYSPAQGRFVTLPLARNRARVIKYLFSPAYGHVLPAADGTREFFAAAGASYGAATDFPGEDAFHIAHGTIFAAPKKGVTKVRPDWVREPDGSWALLFRKQEGNSISFGPSVLPSDAGFTVDMEICPSGFDNAPELFNCGAYRIFTLSLSREGHLHCRFLSRDLSGKCFRNYDFRSSLALEPGKYQRVRASYDGSFMTLAVNDFLEKFPCTGVRLYLFCPDFGGYTPGRFFDGKLRALTIKQFPEIIPLKMNKILGPSDFNTSQAVHMKPEGDGVYSVTGLHHFAAREKTVVDPEKKYTLSGEFKSIGKTKELPGISIGFLQMDAEQRRIDACMAAPVTDSLTELSAPAQKGDKMLRLKDGKFWKKINWSWIMFNAKADCSDLPNRETFRVFKVEERNGGTVVLLHTPLQRDYPEGTPVRQGRYCREQALFTASGKPEADKWTRFSGTVSGRAAGAAADGKWFPGASTAVVYLRINTGKFTEGHSPVTLFRNLKLEIDDK